MMTDWHFATAFEIIADTIGDNPALICGDVTRTWNDFDIRAAKIAAVLSDQGLEPGSKVGLYLHNSNEYLESHHGILKMRGCPINVNYRYQEDELVYLLNNADAQAIIYQQSYADRIDRIRDRLDQVRCLIQVADGSDHDLVDGALDYEAVVATADPMARINRPADDIYMLYTGGTTGMPKGVMYAVGDHCAGLTGIGELTGATAPETMDQLSACISQSESNGILPVGLVCCPLMHGTGMWIGALLTNLAGGAAVTVNHLGLDPDLLWTEAVRHKATLATIVGDAFARPMLSALDAAASNGNPYDLSNLKLIISSGVMWSQEIKEGLLKHNDMVLFDAMGSTEGTMGSSVTTRETSAGTAKFQLSEDVKVFNDDDQEVQPGSGEMGMIATPSAMVGYYKDPEKTAKTVRVINGTRWIFPGDYATLEADGTLTLLGRGSMCINTAGEKVFPEEVEEVLKSHEDVLDCLVVGVPDERFGQKVVGLVSVSNPSANESDLIGFCRERIAGYKLPKNVLLVDHVQRQSNGKADYEWANKTALDMLA